MYSPKRNTWKRTIAVFDDLEVYVPPQGAQEICTTGFGTKSGAVLLPTQPADYGSGKSRALDVIGSICYRPIFLAGSSTSAALRRMIDSYRGTVVADEQYCKGDQDLTSSYIKILNQGFQRGHPVIVCKMSGKEPVPQQFDVFGPKVIVTRTKFNDAALESRFFTINMRPRTRDDIPLNLPRPEFDEQALILRNKLLKYRFDNFHRVKLNSSLKVEDIGDRLNQIGIPLLSTIRNKTARLKVIKSLKSMHREHIKAWSDSMPGIIFDYLIKRWKNSKRPIYIKDIATFLNTPRLGEHSMSYQLQGDRITERKIDQVIRDQLGFKTKRGSQGFFVVLYNERRMEELKRKYS